MKEEERGRSRTGSILGMARKLNDSLKGKKLSRKDSKSSKLSDVVTPTTPSLPRVESVASEETSEEPDEKPKEEKLERKSDSDVSRKRSKRKTSSKSAKPSESHFIPQRVPVGTSPPRTPLGKSPPRSPVETRLPLGESPARSPVDVGPDGSEAMGVSVRSSMSMAERKGSGATLGKSVDEGSAIESGLRSVLDGNLLPEGPVSNSEIGNLSQAYGAPLGRSPKRSESGSMAYTQEPCNSTRSTEGVSPPRTPPYDDTFAQSLKRPMGCIKPVRRTADGTIIIETPPAANKMEWHPGVGSGLCRCRLCLRAECNKLVAFASKHPEEAAAYYKERQQNRLYGTS